MRPLLSLLLAFAFLPLAGCYRTTPPIWLTDLPAVTEGVARVSDSPRNLFGVDGKPFEVEGTLRSVEIEESSELPRATFLAPVKAAAVGPSVKIDSPSGSRIFPTGPTTVARLTYSGSSDRSSLRGGGTALIVVGVITTLVGGVLIAVGVGSQLRGGQQGVLYTGEAMIPGGAILGAVGATLFAVGGRRPASP